MRTFDKAFAGVEPDFSIPDLVLPGKVEDKGQAEFTRTPAQYVNAAYLAKLADQGKALLVKHRDALEKIERELGVQRQFVLAIWGRETAFGAHRSPHYAVQVLATQAYAGRRKDMFRNELIHALKMLEDGILTRETMKSSWAGAMGLTQFMPSEYYGLAYDLDGDGRKDIWNSVPDALASAANQLRYRGWVAGQSWAYEVRLPPEVTCRSEGSGPGEARARLDEARRDAHQCAAVSRRRLGRSGLCSDGRRRLWPSVPGARELHGHQALQHVRPVRHVRRQPGRPHRRRRRISTRPGARYASCLRAASRKSRSGCRPAATTSPRSTARPA